jgi:hypothetical protein
MLFCAYAATGLVLFSVLCGASVCKRKRDDTNQPDSHFPAPHDCGSLPPLANFGQAKYIPYAIGTFRERAHLLEAGIGQVIFGKGDSQMKKLLAMFLALAVLGFRSLRRTRKKPTAWRIAER